MLSFPSQSWGTVVKKTSSGASLGVSKYGRTASLILPRLYLSDWFTARDANELSRLGITHVISIIDDDAAIPDVIQDDCKLHIRIADRPDVDILVHLDTTTEFIRAALAENDTNKVLVHCFQGVSRSATVVCAYIVATMGMLGPESTAYVQSKRGIICPNMGFRQQLDTYATRFVGSKYKRANSPLSKVSKIGGGIAERIRQLKGESGQNSVVPSKEIQVENTA